MKRTAISLIFLLLAACSFCASAQKEPVDYVSTLVGTMSRPELSTGNTYPATGLPWGNHYYTPQTGEMGSGWIYSYTADKIRGIRQTHQPSPWINDYGQFSLMPVTGTLKFKEDERASWFSHKSEVAKPYYYSVYLADYDVTAEVAPTKVGASFCFTYPEADMAYLVVDAFDGGSFVKIDGRRITGYSTKNTGGVAEGFKNWFVMETDTDFDYVAVVADGKSLKDGRTECESSHTMAVVGFKTKRGQKVCVSVGSSFISLEQAEFNRAKESFSATAAAGRAAWNEVLGRIKVNPEGEDPDVLKTFYSCLYRSLLFPREISEMTPDGKVMHYSPHTGKVMPGYLFVDYGCWDVFRAQMPLLNLVYPEVSAKVQQGFVNHYLESGYLPEWCSPGHRNCMVGNNTASIVADAFIKGVSGDADIDVLWEALIKDANNCYDAVPSSGRAGWMLYNKLGYVPCDAGLNESAARTLEYAYDDWCIYQLGKTLGKKAKEIDVYKKRSGNWRNLYDAGSGWMRGRRQNGEFAPGFNPFKWGGDFTEGNALHYTWSVFHDPEGLVKLMGGSESFEQRLDTIFVLPPVFDESYYGFVIHEIREMQIMNMGNYAHGNQPVQHMIYLYNYTGSPWKGQARVREVMRRFYAATPDGYCGDEDNGQTSAWYVFSALGFYPMCPGSPDYELGSPLFKEVVVSLPSDKKLTIRAKANSPENVYVKQLTFEDKAVKEHTLNHFSLLNGGTLDFTMDSSH